MATYAGRASGRRVAWRRKQINAIANPPLALPVLLEAPIIQTIAGTVIASGTLNVLKDDEIIVCCASRHTATRSHNTPGVVGLNMSFAFLEVLPQFSQLDTESAAWCQGSVWYARAAANSSGTISVAITSALSTAQMQLACFRVPGVGAPRPPIGLANKTVQETAGDLVCALSGVPPVGEMGMVFMSRRVSDATVLDPTDFTQLVDTASGSNLQMAVHAKLGPCPQTITYGTLAGNEAQGVFYWTLKD